LVFLLNLFQLLFQRFSRQVLHNEIEVRVFAVVDDLLQLHYVRVVKLMQALALIDQLHRLCIGFPAVHAQLAPFDHLHRKDFWRRENNPLSVQLSHFVDASEGTLSQLFLNSVLINDIFVFSTCHTLCDRYLCLQRWSVSSLVDYTLAVYTFDCL